VLIAVLAAQLGTPRGRYDEHSGKFSLIMKPRFNQTSRRKNQLPKVDASWLDDCVGGMTPGRVKRLERYKRYG
jgi:hypothetical protein